MYHLPSSLNVFQVFHETWNSKTYFQNMYLWKIFAFHEERKNILEHYFDWVHKSKFFFRTILFHKNQFMKIAPQYCNQLGEGNVFTIVCHSLHGGEGVVCLLLVRWTCGLSAFWRSALREGGRPQGREGSAFRGYGQQAGGMDPTGLRLCWDSHFDTYLLYRNKHRIPKATVQRRL